MKAEMGELNYKDFLKKHNMVDSFDSFAVWNHQQAIIDELKHQKSLQELEINQISQSNQEWQRVNSELQKRVDDCAALAKEWRTLAREMCPLDDKYVIGARLGCAQDIEGVLRGKHE